MEDSNYKFYKKVITNKRADLTPELRSSLKKVSNTQSGIFMAKMGDSVISSLTRIGSIAIAALTTLGSTVSLLLGGPLGFVPVVITHLVLTVPMALIRLGVNEASRVYVRGQAQDLLKDVRQAKRSLKEMIDTRVTVLENKKVELVQTETDKKAV